MRVMIDIAVAGWTSVMAYPLRSVVTVVGVSAILVPYLVGIAVSRGIQRDAQWSIQFGADLYVTGNQLGQQVPVPTSWIQRIEQLEGVERVTPRIVGAVSLGRDHVPAVVVGISAKSLPAQVECIDGRLFQAGATHELVVGSQLAHRLQLKPGDRIPPFYHSSQGDYVSRIVGVFRSDVSLWQANLMFTSLETARVIFDEANVATDLLVECRPGYARSVQQRIERIGLSQDNVRPTVIGRSQLNATLPAGLLHREGVFNLLFVAGFSIAILVILVTSGWGHSTRRREIGILKASGWQTDQVLFRALVESLTLGWIAATLSFLLAYVWLNWLNAWGIAGVFLAGSEAWPSFPVPSRLTPLPLLLSFLVAWVLVSTGTMYATWRAAVVPPREAMRLGA